MRFMSRIEPAIDFAASGRKPEVTFIIFLLQIEVLQKVFSKLYLLIQHRYLHIRVNFSYQARVDV